jgi:hypothetical protein
MQLQHRLLLMKAILVASLAGIVACGETGPQQNLDNYLQRLGGALVQTVPTPEKAPFPKLPVKSELRVPLASANLSTLDFLALTGCAVQITIGKRNSSLGIMASDSQRLLLELEYLELAPPCITHMQSQGKLELAGILLDAYALKAQQLPQRIYNATLANTEFRNFWKKPAQLQDYPEQTSSEVLAALAALTTLVEGWLEGDYRANNPDFEILLSEVAKGDGGALLAALDMQQAHLGAADNMIEDTMVTGPLCNANFRHKGADVLPTVVHKYFIAEVQPWSAALGRRQYELLPPIARLETLLAEAMPDTYQSWKQSRDRLLAQLLGAPRRHVELLIKVMEPCGGSSDLTYAAARK